jgi:alpha-glucosidase
MRGLCLLLFSGTVAASVLAQKPGGQVGRKCPSYRATDVQETGSSITAQLRLVGQPCNTYGKALEDLVLKVEAQTGKN